MSFRPRTKRGYDMFEVASCLQKAIRRADTALAGYMALELFESNFGRYAWKRLLTISAEDVAGIVTQEIKALFDSWLMLTNNGSVKRSRIFLSKAVIVLCQARKSRDADHLQNYIYDRELVDAEQLTTALEESRKNPEPIDLPEYTFDCHTRKGKQRGKTKADFFQAEFDALQPRDAGEFDWTIQQQQPPTTD